MSDRAKCKTCRGRGKLDSGRCYACGGDGDFPKLRVPEDTARILAMVMGRKGLRSRPPAGLGHDAERAYYVWRMARFHGGADVSLPMLAEHRIMGDPMQGILDHMADELAKKVYGTDAAGSSRWGALLATGVGGVAPEAPPGLPDSAYPGGPVHDWNDVMTVALDASDEARLESERTIEHVDEEKDWQRHARAEHEAGVQAILNFPEEA